ncbi:Crp/Fnr family transcriptional regulator [Flavobacterium zepuense]|uniref:Crp/Fnr family transcriptional regulator n=1 Tax=Flavobacterium zepuense TaxID=2593302 RepID=A0A552V8I1_9FLAO|nr:Crp/Fnr family transcriptional regulator [Flavobacterium zepuense]TRW26749.1 Crp/Fnr family transcriptional regulator [Flavobacterium zepuense]
MFEDFKNYLLDKVTLTDEELAQIEAVSAIKKLRKRQMLLQEGQVWQYNAFVCKGLTRTFSIDAKGNERIVNFGPENYWTGDLESLMAGTPARFSIDALEDTAVLLIQHEDFKNLCSTIPNFNNLINTLVQKSLAVSQKRINDSISLSAEELYNAFLQKHALVANRIPQHMIASYLGITPETITRIRRNASKKR